MGKYVPFTSMSPVIYKQNKITLQLFLGARAPLHCETANNPLPTFENGSPSKSFRILGSC